jgi:hypothetical protein
LENETRSAEAGHGIIFLLMLGLTLYALARGWWDAVGWLMLFNIIFNAYPVLLQRYNRIRLIRIIERTNRRQRAKPRITSTPDNRQKQRVGQR